MVLWNKAPHTARSSQLLHDHDRFPENFHPRFDSKARLGAGCHETIHSLRRTFRCADGDVAVEIRAGEAELLWSAVRQMRDRCRGDVATP